MDKPLLRRNPSEPRAGNEGEDQHPAHSASTMGSAALSRVESSISVGKQVRNGLYSCCSSLLQRRTRFGICEMFLSSPEMVFAGNQPQVCRHSCYKHWLCSISARMHHWQFRPHIEEGLLSAASFEGAAAMLATVT